MFTLPGLRLHVPAVHSGPPFSPRDEMSSCIRIYESDGEDESRPTEPAESVERPTEPESVEQMPSCFASSCYNVFSTKDTGGWNTDWYAENI